jgi:ribonuclease PH
MNSKEYELEIGGKKITAVFSDLADQANGSVMLKCEGTVILATAVISKSGEGNPGFFNLTVEYLEKFYAAGKILGSQFARREGRPSEQAILAARVTDRTIRPLFDHHIKNAVQVILTVVAVGKADPKILAVNAASIALHVSDIPWNGPVGAVHIGKARGASEVKINDYIPNSDEPVYDLDLAVCGKEGTINMIEAMAFELSDEEMGKCFDMAVEQIAKWEDPKRSPIGKVVEILGRKGDSRAEMASLAIEKGFKDGFSPEIHKEADEIHKRGITESDIVGRRDFRNITTFTIDPIDAKDFDDAISVKFLDNGDVEVGVHIADVSHYLKEGMAMEEEAKQRTTSVYLVDRVIPMLPEVLSNDLCSLVEGKDRLTMSAVFILNPKTAEVKEKWFGETIIHSAKRFTYEQAQEIIEGMTDGPHKKEITTLNEIGKILKATRFKNGALYMETEEVKFKLDDKGVPVEVIRKIRKDAHKMCRWRGN